jgi:hypothetical protein
MRVADRAKMRSSGSDRDLDKYYASRKGGQNSLPSVSSANVYCLKLVSENGSGMFPFMRLTQNNGTAKTGNISQENFPPSPPKCDPFGAFLAPSAQEHWILAW